MIFRWIAALGCMTTMNSAMYLRADDTNRRYPALAASIPTRSFSFISLIVNNATVEHALSGAPRTNSSRERANPSHQLSPSSLSSNAQYRDSVVRSYSVVAAKALAACKRCGR